MNVHQSPRARNFGIAAPVQHTLLFTNINQFPQPRRQRTWSAAVVCTSYRDLRVKVCFCGANEERALLLKSARRACSIFCCCCWCDVNGMVCTTAVLDKKRGTYYSYIIFLAMIFSMNGYHPLACEHKGVRAVKSTFSTPLKLILYACMKRNVRR